jgi:uncharacterized protein
MIWPWVIVGFGILLIGVTKSGFGGGVGLLNIPMIVLAMGYTDRGSQAALGLMLPLLILGDLIAIWQYKGLFTGALDTRSTPSNAPSAPLPPGEVEAAQVASGEGALEESPAQLASDRPLTPALSRGEREPEVAVLASEPPSAAPRTGPQLIKALLPGTALGVVLGGLLLWWFHQYESIVGTLIRLEIGLECIILVGLHWWRQYKGMQTHLMPEPLRSWVTGCFAAVSSTLAHAAGPIIAMYLLPLRLERKLFVGTSALYFFMLNTAKLPAYYASGMFAHAELGFTLRFAPLVFIGAGIGWWMLRRLSDKAFSTIVYGITFALGWYLLAEGVWRLLKLL